MCRVLRHRLSSARGWTDGTDLQVSDLVQTKTARMGKKGETTMTLGNVRLGDKVRDTVSGFTGVCVARTECLNGCWRMTLQPQRLNNDGIPCEAQTFDDLQLEVTEPKLQPVGSKETSGSRDAPAGPRDPGCEAY